MGAARPSAGLILTLLRDDEVVAEARGVGTAVIAYALIEAAEVVKKGAAPAAEPRRYILMGRVDRATWYGPPDPVAATRAALERNAGGGGGRRSGKDKKRSRRGVSGGASSVSVAESVVSGASGLGGASAGSGGGGSGSGNTGQADAELHVLPWMLRFYSSATVEIREDTELRERLEAAKLGWEEAVPHSGRSAKAKAVRDRFLATAFTPNGPLAPVAAAAPVSVLGTADAPAVTVGALPSELESGGGKLSATSASAPTAKPVSIVSSGASGRGRGKRRISFRDDTKDGDMSTAAAAAAAAMGAEKAAAAVAAAAVATAVSSLTVEPSEVLAAQAIAAPVEPAPEIKLSDVEDPAVVVPQAAVVRRSRDGEATTLSFADLEVRHAEERAALKAYRETREQIRLRRDLDRVIRNQLKTSQATDSTSLADYLYAFRTEDDRVRDRYLEEVRLELERMQERDKDREREARAAAGATGSNSRHGLKSPHKKKSGHKKHK